MLFRSLLCFAGSRVTPPTLAPVIYGAVIPGFAHAAATLTGPPDGAGCGRRLLPPLLFSACRSGAFRRRLFRLQRQVRRRAGLGLHVAPDGRGFAQEGRGAFAPPRDALPPQGGPRAARLD